MERTGRLSGRLSLALKVFFLSAAITLGLSQTSAFKQLELEFYDLRFAVSEVYWPPPARDTRFVLAALRDSTRSRGWTDEDSIRFFQSMANDGARACVVFGKSLFDDPDSALPRLPGNVLVLDESSPEDQQLLFLLEETESGVYDLDGILRSVPSQHPATAFTASLVEELGGKPFTPRSDRVLVQYQRTRDLSEEWSSERNFSFDETPLELLSETLADPELAGTFKDAVILVGTSTTEATRVPSLRTPRNPLTVSQFYGCLIATHLNGWNVRILPGWFTLFLTCAIIALLSLTLSGRRPLFLAVAGSTVTVGIFLAAFLLLPYRLDFPAETPVLGAFVTVFLLIFFEFRRTRKVLRSFGGTEDSTLAGEETQASILFTILPKFLMEMERREDDELLRFRRDYNVLLESVARKYHGQVLDYQGDAQMIGFGLRLDSDADHPAEATAAALEIVSSVPLLSEKWNVAPEELKVHAGVCTGTVALGHVGAVQKQDIAAIGDTTNTAARLMGAAMKLDKPVIVAAKSFHAAEGKIMGEELPAVELKGKSAPVEVFEAVSVDEDWRVANVAAQKDTVPSGGTLVYAGERKSDLLPTVGFAAVALLGLLMLQQKYDDLTLTPELKLYDAIHSTLASRAGDPRIVIAGIDLESMEPDKLGPYPWSRYAYAQVLENLQGSGYKGIFFDVMFKRAREGDPEGDEALAAALAQDPRAVVAGVLLKNTQERWGDPLLFPAADRDLLVGRHQLGLIHKRDDADERLRWAILAANETASGEERLYPTAALALLLKPGDEFSQTDKGLKVGNLVVPASRGGNRPNEALIRFGPTTTGKSGVGPDSYRYISFWRLVDPDDPIHKELDGSYIFVGQAIRSGEHAAVDTVSTPVGIVKGVEVHARTFDTILNSQYISKAPRWLNQLWIFVLWSSVILFLTRHRTVQEFGPRLALTLVLHGLVYAGALSLGLWIEFFYPIIIVAASCAAVLSGRYLLTVKALARFVPAEVADELIWHHQAKDRRLEATVLLTDIRGYTTLSEGRSAVAMLDVLNEYHRRTVSCYERHGGQALTYQGDAQIVVFGVFGRPENPARDAVAAALELQSICDKLREEWGIEKREDFDVGAGLCTGEVEVGFLGGQTNRQYSVVGETVRKSHKVQSLSDELSAPVILDQETFDACRGAVDVDDLGMVQPKGLPHEIRLYRAKKALFE